MKLLSNIDIVRLATETSFYLTALTLLLTGGAIAVLIFASYFNASYAIELCLGFLRIAIVLVPSLVLSAAVLSNALIELVSRDWEERLRAGKDKAWEFELEISARQGFDISGCRGCRYLSRRSHEQRWIVCANHPKGQNKCKDKC